MVPKKDKFPSDAIRRPKAPLIVPVRLASGAIGAAREPPGSIDTTIMFSPPAVVSLK